MGGGGRLFPFFKIMSWNHRILAHEEGDIYFEICEVYFEGDIPKSYTENTTVGGDSIKDIKWTLNRMKECANKPILWAGDKFPQEYKIK